MSVLPYYMARRRVVAGGGGGGGDFSNVVLQSHFTGANGSTSFTDESNSGHSITAVGDAQIQSNKLELDGTGDALSIADSPDWTVGGDFCFEVFGVEIDTNAEHRFVAHYETAANQRAWIFRSLFSGATHFLQFVVSTNGTSASVSAPISVDWAPTLGQAYDVCMERSGTTLRAYVDGVMIAKVTSSLVPAPSTAPLTIGAGADGVFMNGRMSALRLRTGVAPYDDDGGYTVPSLPLPTS